MDGGVEVSAEAENVLAASAAKIQSQLQLRSRQAKCINKTTEEVMRSSKVPEPDGNPSQRAAEELANALEVKVNLSSDQCVNGLTNGAVQETEANECYNDAKLLNENSSLCECPNVDRVQNGSSVVKQHTVSDILPKSNLEGNEDDIVYVSYESELQMPLIMRIMNKDLSEPYSIYTYRYFIYNWPKLCFLAMIGCECVGAIVCKLDLNRKSAKRGYIAMLAVDSQHRNKGIGSNLVLKAIGAMVALNADEVVLESEITNSPALRLYENLGFVRDKRLFRYYLNGVDAFRLKLWLK